MVEVVLDYTVVPTADPALPYAVLGPDGQVVAPVAAYLTELAASDCRPLTIRSYAFDLLDWFRFLAGVGVAWERAERAQVRDYVLWLRSGDNPLDHTALDRLEPGKDLDHLRALLVTAGILPVDSARPLTQVTRDLDRLLATAAEADARIVRAWLHWQVLPRLRRLAGDGHDITTSTLNARATLKQVAAFLALLRAGGRQLSTCRQQDLDAWLADRIANRHRIRPFLAWAQQRRHLAAALQLPPTYRGQPEQPSDAEHRWTLARRLVTDDTIDPADRIAALTTAHVLRDAETVTITLGADRLELPKPFATLISSLPRRRADSPAAHLPTAWLFPSSRPGHHLRPVALARRLRTLGIQPRPMRLSALSQLAAELPPGILASILGIRPTTAARWAGLSGGNWTHYPGKLWPAGHGDTR